MRTFQRYAVYYAPQAGEFADRGAAWLGWDAQCGRALAPPELGVRAEEITRAPRPYGFHATIKPPFRLAEGQSLAQLQQALTALAADLAPVCQPGMRLKAIDGFLALIPEGDPVLLQHLAAEVVTRLEPFRPPLNAAEIARRRPERLTPRQRELLDLYGYPFVMEEFRFHLTLTDRLPAHRAAVASAILSEYFAAVLPRPFVINDLCLFAEEAAAAHTGDAGMNADLSEQSAGRFHLLARYPLGG